MVVFPFLQNNPSDYNYFFDTSRRRTCYIAPERFSEDTGRVDPGGFDLNSDLTLDSELSPAMDIFSAG